MLVRLGMVGWGVCRYFKSVFFVAFPWNAGVVSPALGGILCRKCIVHALDDSI